MDRADSGQHPLDTMCRDLVERCHAALRGSLNRVRAKLETLPAGTASADAGLRRAVAALAEQIHGHLLKEEHLLFPAIHALAAAERESGIRPALPFPTVLHPIRVMEAEHVRIESALDRLSAEARAAMPSSPGSMEWRRWLEDLADLEQDLREHHRTENEVLFPHALEVERRLL
jgi:iron-sulfur cluster repair protein YtfE (RIC family)